MGASNTKQPPVQDTNYSIPKMSQSQDDITRNSSIRSKYSDAKEFNMVIMGPPSSGKTSLINRIVFKREPQQKYEAVDYKSKIEYHPKNYEETIYFNMTEIDNKLDKNAIIQQFEVQPDILVLTHSLQDNQSLHALTEQIRCYDETYHIQRFQSPEFDKILILGTKQDLKVNTDDENAEQEKEKAIERIKDLLFDDSKNKNQFQILDVNLKDKDSLDQIETALDQMFNELSEVSIQHQQAQQANLIRQQDQGKFLGGICSKKNGCYI